jgi:hypothetical protein
VKLTIPVGAAQYLLGKVGWLGVLLTLEEGVAVKDAMLQQEADHVAKHGHTINQLIN